jgi:WD40 repeat protein
MGKSDYVPQHYRILILLCSKCLAVLQGHTSLVGQLQMRDDILVTGGSDGSVRVWSLATYQAIHRLAAHDNSVTSLQFDNTRIVSGGSDGRVKVWDLKTGVPVRELSSPAEAVWRVVFEEEKAVIMASRGGRTIMEVSLPRATHKNGGLIRSGVGLLTTPRRGFRLPILHPSEHARSLGC